MRLQDLEICHKVRYILSFPFLYTTPSHVHENIAHNHTNHQSCYSSYCPAQLTEDELALLSSDSSAICNGVGTVYIPSGALPTSVTVVQTSEASTGKGGLVTTGSSTLAIKGTGTGSGAGEVATSSEGVASTSSKGVSEGRMDNVVPVLGGVLGALVGIVGIFL
jgi:hypothetical protein